METGEFHTRAEAVTEQLVRGMNQALASRDVEGCVYGLASYFHVSLGRECPRPQDGVERPARNGRAPPRTPPKTPLALKQGMLNHGVDLMGYTAGLVSSVHTDEDVDRTLKAFEATLDEMLAEGLV